MQQPVEKESKENYRRFFFSRRNRKFPIIPPRLPFRPGSKNNISMATSTTTIAPSTLSPKYHTDDEDPFEISSSVDSPAVFWPVRRKVPSRIFNPPTPTSTTPRPLLKLLQPKPTRPAMYSLHGFVPEPSIRRITTTEAPSYIKELYKIRNSQILSTRKNKVWHLCPGGYTVFRHSFLCPNGTIFNEERGICDWWYNVHCERLC
ncbi:uncharacterized protein LOC106459602 [Limulus polyphemus]|uniref:Uncharacterized protein LOC106459602 n=1 Tax=Limulus polyphemus TaxID=6850 RepID=A0ABM1SDX9_LIMPO|nr:uncharacterized protein LOC106459602 [Limulus polyphemus]